MESAHEHTSPIAGAALPYSPDRHGAAVVRPDTIVLQVDATVSGIDGFAWLTNRRDEECGARMATLQREASIQGWTWAELTQARLKQLRPRRAEVNELGSAYLAFLTPGVVDAVSALRRAGVSVALASDVAAEALFGVATALGVSPDELHAPRLRFDAIGAFVGSDVPAGRADEPADGSAHRASGASTQRWFVGTRRSALFAPRGTDAFVAFSGVVARDGRTDAFATIASFADLTALALR